jgi:hypothetical protein
MGVLAETLALIDPADSDPDGLVHLFGEAGS